ncbi:TetR family transcriptional regulator [[Clostridium] spiroforme]|nr:TetR family transcriptional regulator [Thomasclavelia spiroformis]
MTVKDIVDKCQITRQTFYYHFADITELFRWILEKGLNRCYLRY